MAKRKSKAFVLWFDELGIEDVALVGGKNASLGEMYRNLSRKGVRIPNGFAITAHAYRHVLRKAGVEKDIRAALKGLDVKDVRDLAERGAKVRKIIRDCELPADLVKDVTAAYRKLSREYKMANADVAVRSSATAEDLPEASFAGQQETFLNVHGEARLLDSVRDCMASLFTNRAIAYRVEKKFNHFEVFLSVGVQKMVRADLASAGVMFTLDTESGFRNAVFITGVWGLGENIVQGAVNPDEWYVFKPTLKQGFKPIIQKTLGSKALRMVYAERKGHATRNASVPPSERAKFCLSDDEVLTLAKWGVIVEEHYTKKKGRPMPMDLEWAKDGRSGQLFIVQARPETVQALKSRKILETYSLKERGRILATGRSVGEKIGQGPANVIRSVHDISRFKQGQVLVTEMTDPDWVPIMKNAAAIVTNKGGRTCHAAIVSRELGIPCIVGTGNATTRVKTGQKVTVSCAEGEAGHVYDGLLKYDVRKTDLSKLRKPKTRVMMNVGNPEEAFELSFVPNDGVGLAREEFIITNYIKIHPRALLEYRKLAPALRRKIDKLTQGYTDKARFFVDKLAEGIAMIGAAFHPNDVIVRLSDFKSNEYAGLVGGSQFEPKEENPMIGWRGASRYYNPNYKDAFALECKAFLKVRDEMGLTNVKVMVPFCRTPEEGKKVIAVMKENGLVQGRNGLEVYVMCEIPSNVLLAEEFAEVFDGFSIGTNDLTQLTLGLDRDSALVADLYDERNLAVERLVAEVIKVAKKRKRKIGICGDAPSTYPEFAQFLVRCGIDSISLSPDAVMKTLLKIVEMEKRRR